MAGKRGRKKGQTGEAKAFIEDAVIKPYKIKINEQSFDVIKGDSIQPDGYFTKLSNALEYIARQKTSTNKTFTIAGYVKELKENEQIIAKAVIK